MSKGMLAREIVTETVPPSEHELLKAAFVHFNATSKKLEERYEQLRKEAEGLRAQICEKDKVIKRAEKLSVLGETAAAIAHEVRNPLGAIKLFASLLIEDLKEKPESLALAEEINKSVVALDNVVSNILQFSKSKELQLAPLNIDAIIQEQISLAVSKNPKIEVKTDLQGAKFILGNEHSLRQVFFNLFINALQAMRHEGTLTVTSSSDEKLLTIVVKDSGPGISSAVIEKIFDPFVSTRSEGTGLGLAIVRQIVEGHKGSISVRNNSGAEFVVRLPCK